MVGRQSQAKVDALLRGRLHGGKGSFRSYQRDIRLARLDFDVADPRQPFEDGVKDRP